MLNWGDGLRRIPRETTDTGGGEENGRSMDGLVRAATMGVDTGNDRTDEG